MRDKRNQVMTPKHPKWSEFMERLEGPEGCDFKQQIPGDTRSTTWKCKNGNDKSYARSILETMSDIDVEDSLTWIHKQGGHCDCEILFNVDN
jgi:hypothetical protein